MAARLIFLAWRGVRQALASQTEHLSSVIQRRLIGERRQFQITRARARNEHVAK